MSWQIHFGLPTFSQREIGRYRSNLRMDWRRLFDQSGFYPGDIIIRATDLQNDKASLRVGFVRDKGIIISAYLNLRTTDKLQPEYRYLQIHALDLTKVLYSLGSGLRQNLSYLDFRRLPILFHRQKSKRRLCGIWIGRVGVWTARSGPSARSSLCSTSRRRPSSTAPSFALSIATFLASSSASVGPMAFRWIGKKYRFAGSYRFHFKLARLVQIRR